MEARRSARVRRASFYRSALVGVVVGVLLAQRAHAACNIIPSASKTFRSTLGFTPASPGTPRIVVLTTESCTSLASELAACQSAGGVAPACIRVNQPPA